MSQFIAAVIGFAAGAFAWAGDPLIAFLVALCALVWIAITSMGVAPWTSARKDIELTELVRPE